MDAYAKSKTPVSARDRRATPPEIFHRIQHVTGITFVWDVCAETHTSKVPGRCWTAEDDALAISWHKELLLPHTAPGYIPAAWMNPPYSNPAVWCDKAAYEASKGIIVMGLLPDDRSANWYIDHIEGVASTIWVPDRRISFHDENGKPQNGNPKGSVFALWTPWRARQTQQIRFNIDGMRTKPQRQQITVVTNHKRKPKVRRRKR